MNAIKKITQNLITMNDGNQIPAIGLGTYKMKDDEEIDEAIKAGYEAGYRHIDSAVFYRNEKQIGDAIKKYNIPREELFITTKIPTDGMEYEKALSYVDKALENFQTTYLDLILLHWPGAKNVESRIGAWKALEEAKEKGKVKSIGVSNFRPLHLNTILDSCKIKPAVNQIELHPMYIEEETIELCGKEDILIEAYSPLARWDEKLIKNQVLVDISKKHKKSTAQVLIRWSLQHGWVVLPKSSKKERVFENIDIDDFELSEEEMKLLDGLNCNYKVCWNPKDVGF